MPSMSARSVVSEIALVAFLVMSAALIAAGVWIYDLYMGQLNNTIALQQCVRGIEQEKRVTGNHPPSVRCSDYWGGDVAYFVRNGTYILASAGSDRQTEMNYGAFRPADIPSAETCLTRGADTVFVGRVPVRCCLK